MLDLSSLVKFALGIIPIAIGWLAYKIYILPYYLSPLRNIPGPPSESLLSGSYNRFFAEEAGETHLRWIKQYGNIVKYYGFLNQPSIVVTDAKLIQEILSNQSSYDFPKFKQLRGDSKYLVGLGLSQVEGNAHKKQRKMMSPAFTYNIIKNMVPTFVHVSLTLKGLIEDEVNKGESKMILTSCISQTTLDIIGLVGFNHKFDSLTSPSELAEAYKKMFGNMSTLSIVTSVSSDYVPLIRKIPTDLNKRYVSSRKVIEDESKRLIEEKYEDDKNNKLDGIDLLSRLININKTLPDGEKMTDDELKYQIMTFLLAGHETTSTSTSWALHMLAQHPSEQDLLREELVKAFPDKSKFNPTFDEINSLEYLNCVVKEILRLFPPVVVLQRYNNKDKVFGEHFIPKGTPIDVPIAALHRLPSIWGPTANDFDPKRWLNPSLVKNVTNYNYLPFSTGVRSCIGSKLGLSEFKILLSMLVRHFVFQPVEGLHIKRTAGLLNKLDPHLELMVSKVEV